MRHLLLIALTATSLTATSLTATSLAGCQRKADAPPDAATPVGDTPTPAQPDASTGAGGAVTGAADPNPSGAGAVTDAEPGAPGNRMGSTEPVSPATAPAPR